MKNLKKDEKDTKKKFFNKKLYLAGLGFVLFQAVIGILAFGGVKSYVQNEARKQIVLPNVNSGESVFEEYEKSSLRDDSILAMEVLNNSEHKSKDIEENIQIEKESVLELEPIKDVLAPADSTVEDSEEEFTISMPTSGEILNAYTGDKLLKSKTLGDWRVHNGIDISAKDGEEVFAAAEGLVKDVYDDTMLGRVVILEHKEGYKTLYAGLMKDTAAAEGERIGKGDLIGRTGSTAALEKNEAPHLHFELLKDDEELNPCDYLK